MPLPFGPVAKGYLVHEVTLEKLIFQYNPAQITDSKRTVFERIQVPGMSHPLLQFVAGGNRTLTFRLEFSAVGNDRDIMSDIRWLQSLQYPAREQGALIAAPPRVMFIFGKMLKLRGVITNCQVTYRRWNSDLTRLLEASVDLDFEEYVSRSVNAEEVRRGAVGGGV